MSLVWLVSWSPILNYVTLTFKSALIAVQAGVVRRDMAVVTSFRK